jgi:hypothetical protein
VGSCLPRTGGGRPRDLRRQRRRRGPLGDFSAGLRLGGCAAGKARWLFLTKTDGSCCCAGDLMGGGVHSCRNANIVIKFLNPRSVYIMERREY